MVVFKSVAIVICLCGVFKLSNTQQYVVPEIKFEALKAGGFRVSVPDVDGTKKFSFNANINEEVGPGIAGKINGEVSTPTDGVFILPFGNQLKVGDTVHYKVFVTYNRLGYRKENLRWIVTESDLHDSYAPLGPTCRTGTTTINGGNSSCQGELIIVDEFDGSILDTLKWTVEQKIPTYYDDAAAGMLVVGKMLDAPWENLELNYYHNSDDTRFLKDSVLFLKPIPAETEEEVRGELDLRNGCSSNDLKLCYYKHRGGFIIPPIKSGRITSKISFKYGKVEIKAKLPAGDWIVPVVQLELKEKTSDGFTPKIYIAYSRGNDHLTGTGGDDIGGRLLYAGPALNSVEPGRSGKLQTLVANNDNPYSSDYHTYTLEWLPGKMSFYLDSNKYGTIDTSKGFAEFGRNWNAQDAPFNKECVISLGVAVGGIGEFPDSYKSGNNPKPWTYSNPSYTSTFFSSRRSWLPTWKGDGTALRVEYIKVWAV